MLCASSIAASGATGRPVREKAKSALGLRTVSALLMAAVALAAIASGPIGFAVLIAAAAAVLAWEWSGLVGQRPFEMGYMAPDVMIKLIKGEEVEDPVFTGLDECTKDTADTCIQK